MSFGKNPMEERHPDMENNPAGWEAEIERQRKRIGKGKYVLAANKTWIFVKDGDDAEAKVKKFQDKLSNRTVRGVKV